MATPKHHAKAGGRKKGVPNKVSTEIKEFYTSLLDGERENIKTALKKLKDKDDYQYLMAIDKISQKVIANKKDITSDGESLVPNVTITENRNKSKQ